MFLKTSIAEAAKPVSAMFNTISSALQLPYEPEHGGSRGVAKAAMPQYSYLQTTTETALSLPANQRKVHGVDYSLVPHH